MKILKNKIKILKLLIIIFLISITIIIVNSNIKLFQSDDYIFLKIFQKSVNQPKDIDKTKKEENYIFKVNLKNIDIKQIDLMKTADKSTYVNEKIAPGTSGNFNILLETNKNSKYKIYFQSINEKPKNLYFKFTHSPQHRIVAHLRIFTLFPSKSAIVKLAISLSVASEQVLDASA